MAAKIFITLGPARICNIRNMDRFYSKLCVFCQSLSLPRTNTLACFGICTSMIFVVPAPKVDMTVKVSFIIECQKSKTFAKFHELSCFFFGSYFPNYFFSMRLILLYNPLNGIIHPNYKLLRFLTTKFFAHRRGTRF